MKSFSEPGAVWNRRKTHWTDSGSNVVINQLCDLGCSLSCTVSGFNQGGQIGSICATLMPSCHQGRHRWSIPALFLSLDRAPPAHTPAVVPAAFWAAASLRCLGWMVSLLSVPRLTFNNFNYYSYLFCCGNHDHRLHEIGLVHSKDHKEFPSSKHS